MSLRCLNCQEPIFLDASLREKYPEWQRLTTTQRSGGVMKSSSDVGITTRKKVSSELFLGKAESVQSSASSSAITITEDPGPSTGSDYSEVCEEPHSLGGNLGHFTAMTGNLFDIICNDSTPIDHPMCQECTDKLLDCMDQQLKSLEEEAEDYTKLIDSLKDQQSKLDLNSLRMELTNLQAEEKSLQNDLSRLEAEEEGMDQQLALEKKDLEQVKREEERLWKVYRDHSRRLLELDQDEQSVQNQLKYTNEQLERLSKTNIFNLTFHIWHSGHFGTINGFRLGRLPDEQVDWNEINAAWGQTVLLLSSLSKKLGLKMERFEPVAFGNYSYMKCINAQSTSSGSRQAKEKELPLYCSGGYKFLGNSKFDAGMVAFSDCIQQLQGEMNKRGSFRMPYAMKLDKIIDNEREYSVKIQFNSEERWTKAMKCLLINLKWALAWIASLQT